MTSRLCLLAARSLLCLCACTGDPAPAGTAPTPAAGPPRQRPDVLLITMDTTRQDRIGAYGFGLARTPTLDRLATEGVRFDDHATVAPITLPAHISIHTGLRPPTHGVRDNGAYALNDAVPTLAEQLSGVGYDTAAFVSAAVLDQRYNLDQGFDLYDDDLWAEDEPAMFFIRDRPARKTADSALAWLQSREDAGDRDPFFAWVHFFDPHQPYEVDTRSAGNVFTLPSAYDAEISSVDAAVGRLIAWLEQRGRLDNALVVVTADHGESLGDHGERTHAVFIYDSTIKVPLLMRLPGAQAKGRVVQEGTSAVDVAPTVLGLVGVAALTGAEGLDLSGPLRTGQPVPQHPQYIESLLSERGFGMAPLLGVRQGGMKWIRAPRAERYDLAADPGELHNLHIDDPGPSQALDQVLQRFLDAGAARGLASTGNPLDGETEEMLLAMGYLAPESERAAMGGIDPKDGMALVAAMEDARGAVRAGRPKEAERMLRALLEKTPRNVTAWNVLGYALFNQNRLAESIEAYQQSLALDPRQHRVLGLLGKINLREGRVDEARSLLLKSLDTTPGFVEAMSALSALEFQAGDESAAEAWAQKAYAADPTFPRAWNAIADLRYRQKRWEDARKWYERLLGDTPTHYVARVQAGLAAKRSGDFEGARNHLNQAAALRPDAWAPVYNLACTEAVAAAPDAAMAALTLAAERGLDLPALLGKDPDLDSLRARPEFAAVTAKVNANATASAAAHKAARGG